MSFERVTLERAIHFRLTVVWLPTWSVRMITAHATRSNLFFGVKHEGHVTKFMSLVVNPQMGHTKNPLLSDPLRESRFCKA